MVGEEVWPRGGDGIFKIYFVGASGGKNKPGGSQMAVHVRSLCDTPSPREELLLPILRTTSGGRTGWDLLPRLPSPEL